MKRTLTWIVALCCAIITIPQTSIAQRVQTCGTDEMTQQLIDSDSSIRERYEFDIEQLKQLAQNPENFKLYKKKAVLTIPVVFHVIHNYGPENISKAQILEQMEILNKDFRRQNLDTSKTREIFKDRAVDCEIEFKLATKDPDGNCTDGITRTVSTLTYGGDEDVKDLVRWDYRSYMNVWVVQSIQLTIDGNGLAGYTYRPPTTTSEIDGIIIDYSYVGASGTSTSLKAGRTLTHEVGHWLGLLHPFDNGCGSNCQTSGDFICDTPPVNTSNSGCPSSINTCTNDSPDEPDNHENYMDYTYGSCQNMFTQGQKDLMQYYLARTQYRGQNVSTANHTKTGINISNPCAPIADFQIESELTTICPGGIVSFTDMSWNGDVENRVWTFEGGSPSSSTFANPQVTYNQSGTYKVTLKVSNSKGESTKEREAFITVVKSVADISSPYIETFESEYAPFLYSAETNSDNDGWYIEEGPSASGKFSAVCKIDENTASNERFNLITPHIDLSRHKDLSPILSFRVGYSLRTAGAGERMVVYGSDDCGESWTTLKGLVGATTLYSVSGNNPGWKPSSSADWKVIEINLDQNNFSASTNLLLRFEVISSSGNSIYLDDINVDQFALSVSPQQIANTIQILPNPSNGQFTVQNPDNIGSIHIEVLDANGRLVRTLDANEGASTQINIANSGVYMVRIMGDGFIKTERIIITK